MKAWGWVGGLLGGVLAVVSFAPASWLADRVAALSGDYVRLADARGTLWKGSAVMVLTGGPGSRDASALPGRFHWTVGWQGAGLALRAEHACCIQGHATLRLSGGLGRLRLQVLPAGAAPLPGAVAGSAEVLGAAAPTSLPLGQWPASWLVGLGTPWNTLQPKGLMRVSTGGLTLDWVQGRWLIGGRADVELDAIASRLSPLEVLGNYRISLQGDPKGEAATVQLSTRSGPLQMSGNGQWAASKLRFTGQAQADAGSEIALNNLLNLIGRRQGPLSLLSIG